MPDNPKEVKAGEKYYVNNDYESVGLIVGVRLGEFVGDTDGSKFGC